MKRIRWMASEGRVVGSVMRGKGCSGDEEEARKELELDELTHFGLDPVVMSELTLDTYYVDSKLEQQTEADCLEDWCLGVSYG